VPPPPPRFDPDDDDDDDEEDGGVGAVTKRLRSASLSMSDRTESTRSSSAVDAEEEEAEEAAKKKKNKRKKKRKKKKKKASVSSEEAEVREVEEGDEVPFAVAVAVEDDEDDGDEVDRETLIDAEVVNAPGPSKVMNDDSITAATNVVALKTPEEDLRMPDGRSRGAALGASASSVLLLPERKRSISFGSVSVREYRRAMGKSVVPADGSWPLGLSDEILDEYDVNGDVDGFERRKQEELRRRYKEATEERVRRLRRANEKRESGRSGGGGGGRKKRHGGGGGNSNSSSGDTNGKRDASPEKRKNSEDLTTTVPIVVPDTFLETRQFDYRRRKDPPAKKRGESLTLEDMDDGKNPLFGVCLEKDRMKLIIDDGENALGSHGGSPKNAKKADPDCCPPSPPKAGSKCRRSSSSSNAASSSDKYAPNARYSHTDVTHVRNELERIRNSRSGEGSTGCTCRKIHVHVPGLPEPGGKKHQHRRMPERKVKEELRKRGLLHGPNARKKRDELERILHDAVENGPCCWGDDCPCVHNGIGCQADTCSCWHPGHDAHHHKKGAGGDSDLVDLADTETVQEIRMRCGNKNGMYVVNLGEIQAKRSEFLTDVPLCVPLETK